MNIIHTISHLPLVLGNIIKIGKSAVNRSTPTHRSEILITLGIDSLELLSFAKTDGIRDAFSDW